MFDVRFYYNGEKFKVRLVNLGKEEVARFDGILRENGIIENQISDITVDDGKTVCRGVVTLDKHGTLVEIGRSLM